ncbi:chlorophyllase [Gordonia sp. 'Campus']|uniref:alpha/beta hydrolase family protein n=1 Tax=Gordonia sp. 'Campus' TaxID=2915824 RepID=UPI001EE42DCE|nr:chlorophyllase [Gordonia sp. 'Campus']
MPTESLARQIVAVKPIPVPTPHRPFPLAVKVTAPVTGEHLPVIVFSHGNAWSMDGYEPLVDRWAASGFVVVQPTHPDSRRHGIGLDDPRFASIWRTRVQDAHAVIDHLDEILIGAGGDIRSRVEIDLLGAVGHSWGGQTVGALLGARVVGPDGVVGEDLAHPAVRAGALLATAGTGDSLSEFAQQHLPFMRPDFSTMRTPVLVIAGGKDDSALSTRGPEWLTDAFHLGPGATDLMWIPDGEHTLGGIAGEAVKETTDEDPARVALVADAVAAYLLDALGVSPVEWEALRGAQSPDFTLQRK